MNIPKGVKRKKVQVKEEVFDNIWNSLGKVLGDDKNLDDSTKENQQHSLVKEEDDDDNHQPLVKIKVEPIMKEEKFNEEDQPTSSGRYEDERRSIVIQRNCLDVRVSLIDCQHSVTWATLTTTTTTTTLSPDDVFASTKTCNICKKEFSCVSLLRYI